MWRAKILIILILLLTVQIISATSSASVTFSGMTEPNTIIFIRVDDSPGVTIYANETGYFKKTVGSLDTGLHTVLIYATDNKGRKSNEFITGFAIPKEMLNIAISNIELKFPPLPVSECKGNPDLNHDGIVDIVDLSILLYNWRIPKNCEADQNQDGEVNFFDFIIFFSHWTKLAI